MLPTIQRVLMLLSPSRAPARCCRCRRPGARRPRQTGRLRSVGRRPRKALWIALDGLQQGASFHSVERSQILIEKDPLAFAAIAPLCVGTESSARVPPNPTGLSPRTFLWADQRSNSGRPAYIATILL